MTDVISLPITDQDVCCKALPEIFMDGKDLLSRLRLLIKQRSKQSVINKYLKAAAEEQGVTVSEIADMLVDDFRMKNGIRCFQIDDYKAYLEIIRIGKTEIKWVKPDGSLQRSAPTEVEEKHAQTLKKIKETAKEVEQTLKTQRDRINKMFLKDRKITWHRFKQYYLDHGLMSYLTKGIIWNFHKPDKQVSAICLNNYWVNFNNEMVDIDGTDVVSLWHPAQSSTEEIKAWRLFLIFHHFQQPLLQAFMKI